MTPDTSAQILELRRRLAELERRRAPLPIAALPQANIWTLVEGSTLSPSGLPGIARLATLPATATLVSDLNAPGTLDPGVGIAYNIISGELKLVINQSTTWLYALLEGMSFVSLSQVSIAVTGSPGTFQAFLLPAVAF